MLFTVLSLIAGVVASPPAYNSRPYANVHNRQAGSYNSSSVEVDLGYSTYRGFVNSSSNLDVFLGIRFAAPPVGSLRWQAPRAAVLNNSAVIDATSYPAQCPQGYDNAGGIDSPVDNSASNEDCLFLNIWRPNNVTGPLPVFFYIHGGGYGAGNGQTDFTPIVNTNENKFVAVGIQYRLGAFGFLASDEVYRKGVVNAGLLDQHLALQWVQQYIHLFNGDPTRVTIAGESAGGGSVMLQDMAYGGTIGTQLFINSISASPYLPMQYKYNDWIPSQSYYAFALQAGCGPIKPYLANGSIPIFECLLAKDTDTLINASATTVSSGSYGTWAFLPVTDGSFIQDLPSRQLARGQVNGLNHLSGNNANEGFAFTPQNIQTEDDLVAYLKVTFPLFSNNDIAKLLYYYPSTNASVDPSAPTFATSGDSGPTALNQSSFGTGQQQRADNIYAETTFVCPSYWLVEAYSNNRFGGQGYKYQFSVPPAYHGGDVAAYFGIPGAVYSYDFDVAFQQVYGNFITTSNPSISNAVADGVSSNNVTVNAASEWPAYTVAEPYMIDLNTTCPTTVGGLCQGPTLQNTFRAVNAYSWEGGRGTRCDFWKSVGELVPE